MNTAYRQLSLPGSGPERLPTLTMLTIARKELVRHLLPLAAIFAATAVLFLVLGLLNPPTYKSSATVLVQDNSTLVPLMEGRTAAPNDASRALISRDVLFGQRVMAEVLKAGGWDVQAITPADRERLVKSVIDRTEVSVTERTPVRSSDPKLSLVKITYSDSDAKRAHAVATRYSEALIEQVLEAKAQSSKSAYQFIDAQVEKYQVALAEADKKLQQYRSTNPDAMPGVDTDVAARIAELRRAADNASMDLADAGAQEHQVLRQLSRESPVTTISRGTQANAQLAALQAEESRLMLSYTAQHPDVLMVRNQIRELQGQMRSGRMRGASVMPGGTPSMNPVHEQLRAQLAEVRRLGAAAASRVASAQALLRQELERSQRIAMSGGEAAALTRAHDVNQEVYEDLLTRRENARVSMSLDADGRSLGFQIQEPASEPVLPSGLRLMHFAVAGILVAIMIPMLLLALLVRHDPRVRIPLQIERDAGLPVLGHIPLNLAGERRARTTRRLHAGVLLIAVVPMLYGLVLLLKWGGVL